MQKTDWTPSLTDRLTDYISVSDKFASDSTKDMQLACKQRCSASGMCFLHCVMALFLCPYVHSKIKRLNPSAWVMVSGM